MPPPDHLPVQDGNRANRHILVSQSKRGFVQRQPHPIGIVHTV
jgi:hypothetical protein